MKVQLHYDPIPPAASVQQADDMIRWLRDYGERRVNSRLIDERRTIPPYVVLDFGDRGLFGIQVERRRGGLALRSRDVVRILGQAAALDLGLGTFLLVSLYPGLRPLAAFGSERVQVEHVPKLARGQMLAGYAQTEPSAGTHFAAMEAQAVVDASGYRLTGDKVWIGNATWAGVLTVMAHTVDGEGRRRGLTAFAVETDAPGVVFGPEMLSMGMRGVVQAAVSFRDVQLAADAVVGAPEGGLEVGVDSMSFSRFAIAATCVGSLKRSIQLLHRFASRRTIATGRLVDHPVAMTALGRATAQARVVEALLFHIADALDAGEGVPVELFAAAKVAGSEFLGQAVDQLVQLLGSRGYDEANPAAQLLRDARVTRIFEGATEPLVAFLGGEVLNTRSLLHAWLAQHPQGADVADRLAEFARALRVREVPERLAPTRALARAWQLVPAGWAGLWAVIAAVAASDDVPAGEREHVAGWARAEFEAALTRAGSAESGALDAPALAKVAEAMAAEIGDVEQRLPGERIQLDPLLRRDPGPSGRG